MKSSKTRTCMIGGLGFIGGALSEQLLRLGRDVTIIDTGNPSGLNPKITLVPGDYSNIVLHDVLHTVDEVILLAHSSPKPSFEDPLADTLDNLPKVLKFLLAATKSDLKKIVIISSGGAVYGKAQFLPITEQHPTNPVSPYGITKLAVEKYAGLFHHLHNLPIVIVRPSNPYGPGQRPFTGQGLIATAMAHMMRNEPVVVYGRDMVRDYLHVRDLALGIIAALDKGQPGEVYNIGSGNSRTNDEIIKLLKKVLSNSTSKISVEPSRAFDVTANVLDSTKLRQVSGWQEKTSLEEGLEETRVWLKQYLA